MKTVFCKLLCVAVLFSFGCKEKSHEHPHNHDATAKDVVETGSNQALYNEVMEIHNEVMPKMDDIHKVKQELKEKITKTSNLSEAEKLKIEAMITKLDSAGESMMVWMREFRPLPDSLGEEKAREYLENEMIKVKTVRENILESLREAQQ
jgi:hypothetical protein